MKAVFSLMFLFALSILSLQIDQEAETVKATFIEYAEDTYYFTDKDNYSHEFQRIEKSILETYNLKDDSFKGKSFLITFETDTEEDEEGDDILINIITGLKFLDE